MLKNNPNQLPTYSDRDPVFLNVLLIGVAVVVFVWIVETFAGLTQKFDDLGYFITIILAFGAYVLSRYFDRTNLAKIFIFIYVSGYLSTLAIFGFIQAADSGEIYSIASSLQWVPLIYVSAFLFLKKRAAIFGALSAYLILVIIIVMVYSGLFAVKNAELRMLLLNMGLSHGLYIVCMFAVVQLRQKTMRQTVKALHMEQVANRDGLLEIANRRYLQSLMIRYVENSQPVSILLIDVDHFKLINDTYGHASGDEVLKKVVLHINESLRNIDILGRWGGEEFLILSDLEEEDSVANFANRVRLNVEQKLAEQQPPATISIGVSRYSGKGDIELDIKRADTALYQAKQQGRNRVVLAASDPN